MATEADTTQFIHSTHKKEGDGQELSSEPLTLEFKGLPQEEIQKAEHRLKNPLEIFNLGEGETVQVPTNINVDPANAVPDGDVGTIEDEGFIRGSSVSSVACNEISSDYTKSEYIEQEIDRIVTEEKSEDQTKTSYQDGEDEKSTVSINSLGKEMDVDVNKQKNETTEDKEEKEKEEDAKKNLSVPLVTAPIQETSAREVAQDEEGMLEDEVPGKTTAAFQEREPIESVEEIFNKEKKKATYHIDDMEKESSEENNLSQDGLKKKTEGVEDGTNEISVNDLYYTHPSVNEVDEKQDQDSRSEPQVSQANEESKETTMPMKNETENDKECIESTGEKTFPENPQELEMIEDSTTAQPKVEAENLSVEKIENANLLSSSRVADRNSEDNLNDKEMGIMDSEIGAKNSGSELKELIFDSACPPEETRAETLKDEDDNTTECDTGTSREIPFEESTNNLVELSSVPHVYEEIPVESVTKETNIWEVNREENVQSESFTIVSDKCESSGVNDIPKNIEATDLAENEKIHTQTADDGAAEVEEEIVLEAQSQNHDPSPKLNDEREVSTYGTLQDHMSKQKEPQTKEEQKETTMPTEKEIDNDKECIESTEEKTIQKTPQQVETREEDKSAQANEEVGNPSIDEIENENLPSSTVVNGNNEDDLNENEMGIMESEEEPKNSGSELMEQIVDTISPPEETKVDTLKNEEDKDIPCATDLAENEKIQTAKDDGAAEVKEEIVLEAQIQNHDTSPKLNDEREFSTYRTLQDHMSKQKETQTKEEQKDTTMTTEKEIDNDEYIESTEEKTIEKTPQQVETREYDKSAQANEEAVNQSIDKIEDENLPSSTVADGKSKDNLNEKEMRIKESEEEPKNSDSELMEQIVDTTCPPEETKVDTLKNEEDKETQCATALAENEKIKTQTTEDDGAAEVGEKIVLEAHNQNNDLSPKLNNEREFSTYGMLQDHMSKQKEPETKKEQKDTTMPTEKEIDNDKECIELTEEKTIQNTTQQVETREDNKNAQANEEAGNQSIDGIENENLHSLTFAYGKSEDTLNEKEMGIKESEEEPKNSGSKLVEQVVDSTCPLEETKVDTLQNEEDKDTQCATNLAENEKIQTQTTEDDGATEVGEEIVLEAQSQNHDPSPKLNGEREFSTYGTLQDHMSKQMDPQTKEEQNETTMPTEKEIDSDKECIESTEEKTIQNTTQQVETREDNKIAQAIEEARKKSIDETEIENLPSSTVAYGNNEDNLNEKEMGITESEDEPNNSSSELMEQFIDTTCPPEETIVDTLIDGEDKNTQSATTLAEDEKIQTQIAEYDGAAEVEEEIVLEAQNPNHDASPKLNDESEVSTYGTLQDHTLKQKEPQTKEEQNETTMPTENEIDNDKECIELTEEKTSENTPQQVETREDDKNAQANEEAGNQSREGIEHENLPSLTFAYGKSEDSLNEKEMGIIESEEEPKNSGSELMEQIVDSTRPPEETKVDTLKEEEDKDTQCATDLAEIERIQTQTTENDGAAEVEGEIVLEAQSQNRDPSPKLSDEREFSTYGTLEDHMSKQMVPRTKEEQNETTMPTEKEIDSDKECIESTEEKTIQNTTQQVETREDDKSAQAIEEARKKSIDEIEIENLPSSTVAYGKNVDNLNEKKLGIMESEEEPNNSSSKLMERFIDTTCPPEETIVDTLNDGEDKNTQSANTLAEDEKIHTQIAEYDGAAEVEEEIVLEAQNPNHDPSPKSNDESEVSTYGMLQDHMLKQKEPQTKEEHNETTMPTENKIDDDKECIESTEEKTIEKTPQQVETREDDKNAQANVESGNQSREGIENENHPSLTVAYGKSEDNLNEKEMGIIELEEEPKNSSSELMEQIVDSTRPPEETKVDTLKDEEDKDTQCATDLAEIERIQTQTTEDDGAAEVRGEMVLEDHVPDQIVPLENEGCKETTMPTKKEINLDECIESTEEKTIQETPHEVETQEDNKSAQPNVKVELQTEEEMKSRNLPSLTFADINNEDNLNGKETRVIELKEEGNNSNPEHMEPIFDTICPPEETKVKTLKDVEDNDTQNASGSSRELPYKETTKSYEACDRSPEIEKALLEETHSDKNFKNNLNEDIIVEKEVGQEDLGGLIQETEIPGRKSISTINEEVPEATTDSPGMVMPDIQQNDSAEHWIEEKTVQECFPEIEEIEVNNSAPASDKEDENTEGTIEACYCSPIVAERVIEESLGGEEKDVTESKEEVMDSERELLEQNFAKTQKDKVKSDRDCNIESTTNASKVPPAKETNQDLTENASEKDVSEGILHKSEPTATGVTEEALKELNEENFWSDSSNLVSDSSLTRAEPYATSPNEHALLTAEASETTYDTTGKVGAFYVSPPSPLVSEQTKETTLQVQDMFMNPDVQADIPSSDMEKKGANEEVHDEDQQTYMLPALNVEGSITESENVDLLKISETSEVAECTNIEQLENSEDEKWLNDESKDKPRDPVNEACNTSTVNEKASQEQEHSIRNVKSSFNEEDVETEKTTIELDAEDYEQETEGSEKNCGLTLTTENLESIQAQPRAESTSVTGDQSDKANPLPDDVDFTAELREEDSVSGEDKNMEIPTAAKEEEHKSEEKTYLDVQKETCDTSLICEDEIEVSTSDTSLIHTAEQNLEDTPTLSSGEHNHVTIKPNDTTDEPQVQIEASSVNIYVPAAADIIEDKLFQKQVESMVPKDEAHLASIDIENSRPYEEIHGEDQEMYKMRVLSTEQNVTESEEIKPHKSTKATEIISYSDGAKWETLPVQKSLNDEVEEEAKKVVTSAFNEACDTSIEAEITIPEQIKDQDPMPTENPEVTNYSENEEAAKSKVIRDDFKEENREIYEKTGLQFEAINQSKETWIPIETTKNVTLNEEVPREIEKAKQSEYINRQTVEEQNCGAETGMKVASNEKANKNHEEVELEPSEQVKCLTELEVEDHIIETLRDTQIKEDIQYVKSMTLESSGEKIMEQDNQESETEMPGNAKSTSQSKKESEETQTWIESIKDVTWTEVVPKATDNTTESENIEEEMTKEENCILEHQKTLEAKKDPSTVATDNLEETVSLENPESVKTLAAEELELGSDASSIINAPEEERTNNTSSGVAISVDAYEKENVEEAHLCNDKMHTAPVTLVTQNAASKEFLQEENSTRDLHTSLDDKTHEFKTTFPGLQDKEIENEKLQDKFGILSPVTDDGAIIDNESQNLQTLYTVDVKEPVISDTIYNSKERDVEDIHESRKETAPNTTFEDKCEDKTNEVPETISEPHHQDVDTVIASKVLQHTLTSGNITEQVQQQSCDMPSMEENHEIKPKSEKIEEGDEKKVEYLVQEISEESSKEEDVHSWTSKNEATNIPSHCSTVDGISTLEVDDNCEEAIPLKFWNNENALQTIYGEEAEELAEADTKEEKIATAITGPKVEEHQSGIANEASEITTNEIKAEMVTEKDFVNETLVELPDKEPVISNYDEDVQVGIEYPGKRETEEPETNINATPSVKLSKELESASLNEDDKKHIKGKDGAVEDSCRDKSTGVMTLSEEVNDQEFVMVKHNEGKESAMNREALMTDNNALGEKAPPKVAQEADEISVGIQETIQAHNVEKDEEYINSTKRLTDDENPEHKTLESASGECHITDSADLKEQGISLDDTRTLLPSRDLWNESTVKEEPDDIISDKQIAAEIIIPEEVKSEKYEQEHRNDEEEVDLTKSERTVELNEAKIDDIVHVDGEVETEDPSDKRNISSHKKVLSLETTQSDIRMDLVPDKDAQVFSHPNESKEFRISTGSKEIPEVQQKLNTQTFHNSENLKPENASAAEPEAKEGECLEETIAGEARKETREEYSSTESAQNLLSAKRTSQVMELSIEEREPKESKKLQADEAEGAKIEEAKEDEEEGDEHKNLDSGSDAQVMVAAFNDVNEKAATHKKSHNILSGVGSKVKHSIAKVKKAITGKSSHPKPSSPK